MRQESDLSERPVTRFLPINTGSSQLHLSTSQSVDNSTTMQYNGKYTDRRRVMDDDYKLRTCRLVRRSTVKIIR